MQELRTREQVAEYLRRARIFQQDREVGIYQTEFAWVCWMLLTQAEQATAGRTPGTGGCCIVDATTGVVTSYGSAMHPITWGERYDQAVRAGEELPGPQIYPHRWRLNIQLTREEPTEIEYQVTTESLIGPPEPTTELLLILVKKTLDYRTNVGGIPEPARQAAGWVVANRRQGVWPDHLVREY